MIIRARSLISMRTRKLVPHESDNQSTRAANTAVIYISISRISVVVDVMQGCCVRRFVMVQGSRMTFYSTKYSRINSAQTNRRFEVVITL